MTKIVRILKGCVSPQTAFVQADYPYGRELRCQRKCWLEYKAKKGFRFVTQTQDPRTNRWNKPHASTYTDLALLTLTDEHVDERGEPTHVGWIGASVNSNADQVEALCAAFWDQMDDDQQRVAKTVLKLTQTYGTKSTGRRFVVTDSVTGERLSEEPVTAAWHGFAGAVTIGEQSWVRLHDIGERYPESTFACPVLGKTVKVAWVQEELKAA